MKTIEIWKENLKKTITEGATYIDNSNRGRTELVNHIIKITDVSKAQIEEPLNKLSSDQRWIYPTKKEIANIIFKDIDLPLYDYTYGERIFNYNKKIDQINEYVIPLLKKNPQTRRAVVSLYNPEVDTEFRERNTPSIMYIQFRIYGGALHTTFYIRSLDLFFGWPSNIYQIYALSNYVAEQLKIRNDSITTIANSAHIFISDIEYIKEITGNSNESS